MPTDKPALFSQLFTEFRQNYLSGDGQFRLAAYLEIRSTAYANYGLIAEQANQERDLTELVLLKLLPYTDSTNNRWQGAWTHVAAAVPSDIRKWYGTAGRISQDEWPTIANAIWRFVHRSVESPNHLKEASVEFSENPATKGFQQGMLTPILNALQPDHFALVNNRVRQTLHYFTGIHYDGNLLTYPQVNQGVYDFLTDLASTFTPVETAVHPGDLFECFCYWLHTVRRFPLRTARYWLIGAGEDPWPWAEWKDGGFIALGWEESEQGELAQGNLVWDELGDLAHISRNEFIQRRDSLMVQYPHWPKEIWNQAWHFSRQIQEGDQLLVYAHPETVLAIGTVIGDYYYAAELPHSHRIPVQWDALTPLHLPVHLSQPLSVKLLHEIDHAMVQQIRQSPKSANRSVSDKSEKSVPTFVEHLAPILSTLRTAEEGMTTAELIPQVNAAYQSDDENSTQPAASSRHKSIHRARHYLAKAGLIESPRRGVWRVTAYGANIALEAKEMARIVEEVEYQQRIEETLRHESPTIRRLAEEAARYETASQTTPTHPSPSHPSQFRSSQLSSTSHDNSEQEGSVDANETSEIRTSYPLEEFAERTGIDQEDLLRWSRALRRKKQMILYGPSGTGKTYLAHHLAYHLIGGTDGFWELVQFHPAYAYEDFVQGIRPLPSVNGSTQFVMKPGRFLGFCYRATEVSGPAVLIIDEINRANLTRVFGELMYLLEYRDGEALLAGNGESFRIPPNVYIIGTMNRADRSTSFLDHALRRRFAFVQLRPNYDLLRHFHQQHSTGFPIDSLIRYLVEINQLIGNSDYALGITYFLRTTLNVDIQDIWQLEVEPYLEEHFFDQVEIIERFRWSAIASDFQ
ncbi:MAG: AAA family ATPase [Chloroflexota bacterium]